MRIVCPTVIAIFMAFSTAQGASDGCFVEFWNPSACSTSTIYCYETYASNSYHFGTSVAKLCSDYNDDVAACINAKNICYSNLNSCLTSQNELIDHGVKCESELTSCTQKYNALLSSDEFSKLKFQYSQCILAYQNSSLGIRNRDILITKLRKKCGTKCKNIR